MHPVLIVVIVIVATGCVAGSIIFVYYNNNRLTVASFDVGAKIEKDLTIVHLSDLHAKRFGKNNKRLLERVSSLQPDLIVFTGDIIHKYRRRDLEVATATMEYLTKISPVLFVSGNHEKRNKNYRYLCERLERAGAQVLDNATVKIKGISVSGLDCSSLKNDTIFTLNPEGDFKLLLAHMPRFFPRYASAGFDLVLCGHAHGGQWRIPFTELGVYAPGEGILPKYCRGMHSIGDSKMIVSCGLGNSEFPLRIFNPPQIIEVKLRAERERAEREIINNKE